MTLLLLKEKIYEDCNKKAGYLYIFLFQIQLHTDKVAKTWDIKGEI